MYWIVVHFIEEDTVEAVPLSWIDNEYCHWPPFTGLKLKTAISRGIYPENSWIKIKVRVIGKASSDFNKARMKAVKAETGSDLNSDVEVKRHRIKTNRFIEEEDGSNVSSSECGSEERLVATKSQMPVFSEKKTVSETEAAEADNAQSVITPSSRANDLPANAVTSLSIDETFKKQVFRQFSIINYKLDQLMEDMTLIRQNSNKIEETIDGDKILDKFDFPLKTVGDLKEVETFLESNQEIQHQFVKEIAKTGGVSCKVMVKRVMGSLLTNQLALNYSSIGFKSKQNFSILLICKLIEAVGKVHNSCTLAEVEAVMKMWLVKAMEREKNKNKIQK